MIAHQRRRRGIHAERLAFVRRAVARSTRSIVAAAFLISIAESLSAQGATSAARSGERARGERARGERARGERARGERASGTANSALMGPGVSTQLASLRRASIHDVRYTLALDVTKRDTASGRVTIAFDWRSADASSPAVIDFRGLGLDSLTVNGASTPITGAVWNRAHLQLSPALLRRGTNTVSVVFRAPIAAAGASIIRTHDATDNSEYLYTLLVPSDANLLFPCFDQPDLKARLQLTLTTPREWRALANGVHQSTDSSGFTATHHFAETAPLSTYLFAFAAGPWRSSSQMVSTVEGAAAVPVSLWVRGSRAKAADTDSLIAMNARALRWLGGWFGIPYAFGKFDFLLAPAFPFGGMEHPGAVFYNEESFIYREPPTTTQLLGRQATIYHEVAHQWFGDYMTMRWFDDLWLKEGFATYMAAKMQAALEPNANAWKTFYLRNKPVAYSTDATAGTTPVWQSLANLDQAKSNYGPIVYNKAPGVLRQLNYLVGETAFQRGVQQFLKTHPYGNATWRDLLSSIGTAAGRDLSSWGASWILRPGMPVIEQQVRVANGRIARLTLTQRPAQPALSGSAPWPIKTQLLLAYSDGRTERIPVEMTGRTLDVAAARGKSAPDFVFANYEDFGYALVLPDSASVAWLEQHVGSVRDDFLRAMLWGSLWDLVREARLAPERFAAIALRELPAERDEQLIGSMTGRLSTALARYASTAARDSLVPQAESLLLRLAADTGRAYGPRRTALDAVIGLAGSPGSLARLDGWLDQDSVAGIALRAPTRWRIVTRLVARSAPSAEQRLAAESRRDSTSEGKRLSYVAQAARPDAASKQRLFAQWFSDKELNEEWVTASLGAFNDPEREELTRSLLRPALDTLPWIQQNRRIFFLGSWLGSVLGGQTTAEALGDVDAWLASHPRLATDLRQKVLQSRDELERTVRIRQAFSKRALQ